jgi:HemY protein
MIDDPETRLLGLRGLYLEAERLGDRQASRHYAARAADIAPQLGWAAESTIEEKIEDGDWDSALKLLEAQKGLQKADRAAANRKKAVVLTAKAMAIFDTDPHGARAAALEANRLLPDFVPAAIVAARTYFRNDDIRKGSKLLEAAWRAEPQPELADVYVHARPGDATHDRLARAKKLQSLRTNHVESSLAVARAAMEAQEYALAREEAETSIRLQPRESAFLLLADIEEAQSGNVGKVRQWLARAVRAPRDPAWVADGVVADHWAPLSPVTGRLDAFEWKVPVERLTQTIEQLDAEEPATEQALIEANEGPEPYEVVETIEAEVVEEAPAPAETTAAAEPETETETPADTRPPLPANDAVPRDFNAEEASDPATMPLPDDPGVDPDDEKKNARRFKLF